MTIPFAKSGLKRSDVLENTRKSLVAAIKRGSLFALYLGGTSIEHADWKKKLCKKVKLLYSIVFATLFLE